MVGTLLAYDHLKRSSSDPEPLFLMNPRAMTIAVAVVDTVAWAVVALYAVTSGSDAATRGLDHAAALIVTALYLLTGAPALALGLRGRAPVAALTLALAFPAAFAAMFIAVVIGF